MRMVTPLMLPARSIARPRFFVILADPFSTQAPTWEPVCMMRTRFAFSGYYLNPLQPVTGNRSRGGKALPDRKQLKGHSVLDIKQVRK